MGSNIISRLKVAIDRSGMSPRAISIAAGMSPDALRGVMRNEGASPTIATIQKLAGAMGVHPEWLAYGTGEISTQSPQPELTTLFIIGEVAAGRWQEAITNDFEPEPYHVPADPRFPATAQYLLRVRGASINRRAPDGALVRCLDIWSAPRSPRDGDWVVARRERNGDVEVTVKQLRVSADGRQELWPDSTDPRWQEPICVGEMPGYETTIQSFVLDFINTATRL